MPISATCFVILRASLAARVGTACRHMGQSPERSNHPAMHSRQKWWPQGSCRGSSMRLRQMAQASLSEPSELNSTSTSRTVFSAPALRGTISATSASSSSSSSSSTAFASASPPGRSRSDAAAAARGRGPRAARVLAVMSHSKEPSMSEPRTASAFRRSQAVSSGAGTQPPGAPAGQRDSAKSKAPSSATLTLTTSTRLSGAVSALRHGHASPLLAKRSNTAPSSAAWRSLTSTRGKSSHHGGLRPKVAAS
mmetsp:Transcript_107189/g.298062  ORF Transcript_107189/g.298062 Transcript_107189/m.298062 type:complete len:251 (-) Transcript_107189:118-870(-)